MKKNKIKKVLAAVMAGTLALSLTACGKDGKGTSAQGENGADNGAYVYVPQYITLKSDEESWISDVVLSGNRFYYSEESYGDTIQRAYYYRDMADIDAEPVLVLDGSMIPSFDVHEEDNTATSTNGIIPCEDGVILITNTYPLVDEVADEAAYRRQMEQTTYSMYKLDAEGNEVFRTDITEQIQMAGENSYLQYTGCDREGNIFITNGQSYVWVYDKEGNHVADVTLSGNGWISTMGVIGDGRMAILSDAGAQMQLMVYDEKMKNFSETYEGLPPNCWNSDIAATEKGLLLHNDTGLYEYDLESKTYEEVLKWLSCDMNPDYVDGVTCMADGNYLVYINDWGTGESSLVILKKTDASQVVEKETLTLACLSQSQYLQSAVVNFNKTNEQYRIEIVDYMASIDWSSADAETEYQDAITRFNSDIIAGTAADMFYTGDIDMEMLAVKGAIEDLTPYLENSQIVDREDLFEKVLDAYTVNGILCGIPSSFTVNTLAGRTSEVGTESGWTLEEMMEYAKEYPDADILPEANKLAILYYCMLFDFDSWVNWEAGECYFDTPEFKQVLEFANSYEDAVLSVDDSNSLPIQLRNHEVLLYTMDLSEPYSWQIAEEIFGEEITAIGFPSSSTNGVMVMGNETISISAASDNKEAAWSFIESMLTEEAQADDMFRWGFPIRISTYEELLAEAMEPNYQYDENGEIALDKNGEPIEVSNYGYGWGDFEMEVYSVSQEEADKTLETINRIDGVFNYNEQLMAILEEETAPYFEGQKTVDEVADIIQSRVQIYVSESR
ncbi:MAG: extracellular solute-binding protein [Lachnospiraceae bacterium]|nr:extracellular solute-binding protein [Lachnospiraceae bacterium]